MQHTIEIPEAGLKLYMPATLADCDAQQYMDVCELLHRYHGNKIGYEALRVQAVYKLLNLEPSNKSLLSSEEDDKWTNIYMISLLVDGYFEDKDGQKVIQINFAHTPVPHIALAQTYYGPENYFNDVAFGEYLDALRLFLDFSATGDTALLYALAAVLYRPRNKIGKKRRNYNPDTVAARAETFKFLPDGFIYGVFLMFAAFQKYITTATVPWGGNELDFSILFEASGDGRLESVPGLGMDDLAFDLAESGTFGDFDKVRETNLWTILLQLYKLKKKDLDYKLNEKK